MADSDKKASKRSKTKSRSRRSSARYDDAQDEDEAYANTKVKRKKSKGSRVGISESPTHAKGADSPKRRLKGSGSTTDGSESPSLPKELTYEYFEQLEGNLRRAGELLEEHGRGIVWQAADVIACIPEYCPPRRYGTKLCRCNTCCERCCVDEEHQLRGFHSNVRDQATDVPDEEGLTLSGSSDTSVASLLQDVSSEEGISKASARLAVASRDAKRALRLAKQFRAAARTIDSLECSNESEHQMRALYTKELMDKAVFYAKKANEALAGYAALRRALRGVAGTTSGEELSRLDALEDAHRRLPYYPSLEPTYFQGERPPYGPLGQGYGFDGPRGAPGPLDAQRLRWASAPEIGHPPSVQTALNLSKMADMVMSKAQQASEEALRFQRVSEEALGEAKMLEGVSDARLPPFELNDTRKAPDLRPIGAVGFDDTATECSIGEGPSIIKGITKVRMPETTGAESDRQPGQLNKQGLPQPRGFRNDQTTRKSNAEKRSSHKDGSSDLEVDLADKGQRATGPSATHSTKHRATRRASVSAAVASQMHNRAAIEQSQGKLATRASGRRASVSSLQQEHSDTDQPHPPRKTKSLAARRASVGAGLLLKLGAHMKDSSESSSPEKETSASAIAPDSAGFKARATRRASVSPRAPSTKAHHEDMDAFRSKAARRASVSSKALPTSLDRTTADPDSFKANASRRASVSSKALSPPNESMRNEQDQYREKAIRRASVLSRDFPVDLSDEYETFKVKTARRASVSAKGVEVSTASEDGSFKAKAARRASVSSRLLSPNLYSPSEGQNSFKAKIARRASVSPKFPAGHTELSEPFNMKAARRASVSRATPESPPEMSEPFKSKAARRASVSAKSPEGHNEEFETFKAKAARRASVSAKVAEGPRDTQHESFRAKVARRASLSAKGLARQEGVHKQREGEFRRASVSPIGQSSQPGTPTHESHAHKAKGTKVTVAQPDIPEASNRPAKKPPRRASVCAAKYKRLHGDVSAEQATKSDGGNNWESKLLDEPTLLDKQARRSSISAAKDSRDVLKEEHKKPESGSVPASAITASGPSLSKQPGKSALREGTEDNKQPPAAVAQERTLLSRLLEPSTARADAETTKDAKGGRIVVKIKPPPVHMSSKKVGTRRATKDKGLITDICDEFFHDNCGSYPAGPREIEQIIDEGVGKPRYTKDMKRGQMMSRRIPEIIYELSEQSLDIEVVPSERCKGTQSPLPFDSVPFKGYHCSHAIASTNDSANKEAPRNKMLDTMQGEAVDRQVRHEGMPKHSKHMHESGYAPPKKRKAAEKAHDATEVHSSRRLSSTTDWMTNEDAQSTSKRHDIKKASEEKRTNPDSHRIGSDAHLKVLGSDTYVFMAATAAIAGGDAKNPKASTAAVKDSKKMGKEAGSAESPRKSSRHSNESPKHESGAGKSSGHSKESLKRKSGAEKTSGHSKESLEQKHGAKKPSGPSNESVKQKHCAEKSPGHSGESLKQKHGAEKSSGHSDISLKQKHGAEKSSVHSKESLKEKHGAEKSSGHSDESLKRKYGAEKSPGHSRESLKQKHGAEKSSVHSKESLKGKHGAEKSSGHSDESLKQKRGAEKSSGHSKESLKQKHGAEKSSGHSDISLKQKHGAEKSSGHSDISLKQKHGAEKSSGHSKESLRRETGVTNKRSSSLKPAKGSSESANEPPKREKTPPMRHEKEAQERDEQHSDRESARKTEKRADKKAEEEKRKDSKDVKAADLEYKGHKASVKKGGEDSDLKSAKSSDEDVNKRRKESMKKGDKPTEDSDQQKESGGKREVRERSGTGQASEGSDDKMAGKETKRSEDGTVQRLTTHRGRSKNGDESRELREDTSNTKVLRNLNADQEKEVPFTVEVESNAGLPWNVLSANQNFELAATVRNDADYAKSKYKQVIASPDYIPEEKHTETRPAGADGFYNQQLAFAVGQNAVGSSSSGMDMASCALDDVRQLGQEPAELVVPKKLAFGADDWTIVSPLETYSDRNEPPNVSRPGRSEDLTASESAQVDSRSERLYNDPQTRELHDDSTEEDLREPEGKASWSQQQEGEQQERESSERDQPEELQDDELPELELPEEEPPEEGSPGEEISEQEYLEEEAPVDENVNAVEVPEPEPNEEVQQALGDRQDRGMQEVIELQNVDYELQSRPHAPLRGPDIRDFNFWDLDGPAVLYPESRLVFALAFVAGMWVLYLLFTTRATPNSKPRLDLFTALATAHEIPRERIMAEPFAVNDLKTKGTAATEMESIVSVRPRFLYICDTLYCRESALHLARTLGEDPCSNFYNYACGKLTRKWSPMVGSALSTDAFIVDEAAKLTANYILNQEHPGMKAARNLLEACLNHEHDEQWGRTELSELFFEYFGSSWPAENNAVTMEAVWVIAGRLARDLKLEVLARVYVGVHPEDNSSTVPTIDEPVLLYRRADFKETGYSEMLKTAIEQAVTFISPATNGAPYVSSIKTTMELLADMVSTDSAEAKRHRLTKVRVLPTGMRTFLRTVFLDSVRVAENVDILVKSMRFFENLQGSRSSLLDPQAVFNYVGFRVMVHFAAFLPQPNVRRLRALEANYLLPENASAQDFCTREVERVFPAIYTHAFALQTTNLSNWLSAWSKELKRIVTQARAPKPAPVTAQNDAHVPGHRLDSLKVEAAVPQWILNDSSFGPYAQGLERQLSVALNLDPSNSLKRLCSFSKMLRQDEIEQALQGAFENRSVGSLFGTDARYDALTHTIYVPLVTVNWSLPADSIAFAMHAARYAVRVFKALAPMLRQDYTRSSEQPNSSEVYSKGYQEQPNATTRCLVEQYENASRNLKSAFLYKMTDRTLLGPALLDQTTALVQAYSVFKEKLRARRFENSNFRLVGLPHLTPEQLFFVAYGQDNCEVSDTVRRRRQWHEHGELPPEDRVNIPLMQFEEFARVFACNDTAPMATDRLCPMSHGHRL